MRQHFLPRGQYTPECRKGLGQDVSRADEIGIALVIAGDTAKHLSLAVAPIVLTTSGRVEERRGGLGHRATLRFHSPLIEPDVRFRIRLSDKASGLRSREAVSTWL
jgi:hypothetical protein